MILTEGEAFGSFPEECGCSGFVLDVTLTQFFLTFHMFWRLSHSQINFGRGQAVTTVLCRDVWKITEKSSERSRPLSLWTSWQVVLLLPKTATCLISSLLLILVSWL